MGLFFTSQFEKNVQFKQKQREERIAALPEYQKPLTKRELFLLDEPVSGIVKQVQNGELTPRDVLKAYGKAALVSQEKTNALTEIMIKDAENWADQADTSGPLGGFPVSLKDPYMVKGYDALAGYASMTNKPFKEDGTMVKIIKAAGGYPYVKTNVPSTMMAIEGYNEVWGRTVNPHNPAFAPGGSSQGEGALIGSGGSRIGIGTDIGGSVRVPAAWSGITSLRFTSYRFPQGGDITNDSGFDGVPVVASPMARTIGDLRYFIEAIFSVDPWKFDFRTIHMPWRSDVRLPEKPKVGILRLDDMLVLTPAQNRALNTVADALEKQGCELVEFKTPVPAKVYEDTVFQLYAADGYKGPAGRLMKGEHNDPYVLKIMNYVKLPSFVRKTWEFFLNLFGYKEKAELYRKMRILSAYEYYQVTGRREKLREGFRKVWNDLGIDFMITAPHPSPAIPNLQPMSFHAILFTSLFNLLDYPSGILPVGRVHPSLDKLPKNFDVSHLPFEGKISIDSYDSEKMAGLPTAVQVVGMRYHDEETLAAMEFVTEALRKNGTVYK